jgi:hypothetical protein
MKDELAFYVEDAKEINKKLSGKQIAIVDNQVVASGDDPKKAWKKLKRNTPKTTPDGFCAKRGYRYT